MDTERWQILLKAIDRGSLRAAAEEKVRRESVLQSEIAGFVGFGRGYEE